MSLSLTQQSVIDYVRLALGEPVIEVELTDDQIKSMITQTLSFYGSYKPLELYKTIPAQSNIQKYVLTAEQVGKGVVDVTRPDLFQGPMSLDQFDVFKYHTFQPNLDPGDFYAQRIWWNEIRRSAGSDDDWEFTPDPTTGGGTLYISPRPSNSFTLGYWIFKDATLSEVPPADDDLVKDYVLALCKETLGRMRSKYKSVNGAESALEMDGAELRSEGKEERHEIEEYLRRRGQVVAPIRG